MASVVSNSSQWFIPRVINSFLDAVDQQAIEYLESVESIKNGTSNDMILEFPTFIRVLQNVNYFISPYAAACMIMAIVLNRTIAFAASSGRVNTNNRFVNGRRGFTNTNWPKVLLRLFAIGILMHSLWDVIKTVAIHYGPISYGYFSTTKDSISVDSLLWKVFMSFCISNFIETLIAVNSGQLPFYDTALTLFEHSLAFQESRYPKVPSSQLLIILISSISNQIVVQLFGLFELKKYLLIPSTIFGLNLIGIYLYNFYMGTLSRIPLILIVSILPQIIVLFVAVICSIIFALAVFINGTTRGLTYTPMIANLSESLNFQLSEDFNSLITRFGLILFNALDHEEYVNEYSSLRLKKTTYLEDIDRQPQSKSYLVSSYFNKIEENPDSKFKKIKPSNSISTMWSLIKRYINLFNLFQNLFKFIFYSIFNRRNNQNDTTSSHFNSSNFEDLELLTNELLNIQDSESNDIQNQQLSFLDDDSNDFEYESESDIDPLEYDSDFPEDEATPTNAYIGSLSEQRIQNINPSSTTITTKQTKTKPIDELFQPNDFLSLIKSPDAQDYSNLRYLRAHYAYEGRLTRSAYSRLNQDEILRDFILQTRQNKDKSNPSESSRVTQDENDGEIDEIACVVCQTNHRSIILWPCKCLAVCENCRLSLGVRGFNHCVCCRRKVDGFCKIYIP